MLATASLCPKYNQNFIARLHIDEKAPENTAQNLRTDC